MRALRPLPSATHRHADHLPVAVVEHQVLVVRVDARLVVEAEHVDAAPLHQVEDRRPVDRFVGDERGVVLHHQQERRVDEPERVTRCAGLVLVLGSDVELGVLPPVVDGPADHEQEVPVLELEVLVLGAHAISGDHVVDGEAERQRRPGRQERGLQHLELLLGRHRRRRGGDDDRQLCPAGLRVVRPEDVERVEVVAQATGVADLFGLPPGHPLGIPQREHVERLLDVADVGVPVDDRRDGELVAPPVEVPPAVLAVRGDAVDERAAAGFEGLVEPHRVDRLRAGRARRDLRSEEELEVVRAGKAASEPFGLK